MLLTKLVVNFDINKMQFNFKLGSIQMLFDEKGRLSFQDKDAKKHFQPDRTTCLHQLNLVIGDFMIKFDLMLR